MRSFLTLLFIFNALVIQAQERKLLLVAGQSNARGSGDSTLSPMVPNDIALEFSWENNNLIQLNDPVGETFNFFQQAGHGSCWPAYANTMNLLTGDTLIMVPAARGGTSVTPIPSTFTLNWSSSGILFDNARQKTNLAVIASGLPLSGMVWIQGEKDAKGINQGVTDKASFKAALINFFQRVRNEYGCALPIYMVQTGTDLNESDLGYQHVREVQEEVANTDRFTTIVYFDAINFPALGWMYDNVHYTQEGYNDIGEQGAIFANKFNKLLNTVNYSGPTTFCEGDSLVLTAPNDFTTYLWSNGDTGQSVSIKETGVYYVTASTATCDYLVKDSVVITVNPKPTKEFVEYTGEPRFCEGDSIILSIPNGFNYSWNTGSTQQSITITTAGDYYFKTVNAFGCTGENSDTVTVLVDTLPSKPILQNSGATTFCEGGSVDLILPTGAYEYEWNTGETTAQISVQSAGQYYANLSNTFGCTSENSDSVLVTVDTLPSPPNIIVDGLLSFCEGDSVLLEFDKDYDASLWSTEEVTSQIIVKESGQYFGYALEGNCLSLSSDTIDIQVFSTPDPFLISTNGSTTLCEGDSLLLWAPLGSFNYLWSTGEITQTIAVSQSGNYACTLTSTGNCSRTSDNNITTTVLPRPDQPSIIMTDLDSLMSTIAGDSYTWYLNSQELDLDGKFVFPNASGNYQVSVFQDGCHSILSEKLLVERLNEIYIEVFPSPNSGLFTVELNNLKITPVTVQIVNSIGQVLYQKQVEITGPVTPIKFDLPTLTPATYYAVLIHEKRIKTKKFIVH